MAVKAVKEPLDQFASDRLGDAKSYVADCWNQLFTIDLRRWLGNDRKNLRDNVKKARRLTQQLYTLLDDIENDPHGKH